MLIKFFTAFRIAHFQGVVGDFFIEYNIALAYLANALLK
jgi:hypothetical protein